MKLPTKNYIGGKLRKVARKYKQHPLKYGLLTLVTIILASNLVAAIHYRKRFLPRTTINNIFYGNEIHPNINDFDKTKIYLSGKNSNYTASFDELGVNIDKKSLDNMVKSNKMFSLMLIELLKEHRLSIPANINQEKLQLFLDNHKSDLEQSVKNATIFLKDQELRIIKEQDGYAVNKRKLSATISSTIFSPNPKINLPYDDKKASITESNLKPVIEPINNQLNTEVSFAYSNGNYNTTDKDRANWLTISDHAADFDKNKVLNFIESLEKSKKMNWSNKNQAANQTYEALRANKKTVIHLQDVKYERSYSYCTRTKNISDNYLLEFQTKANSVLIDSRGWSLNGRVQFIKVSSGCDFTLWLANANDVSSFSPGVCDNYYSCRAGNNVIINFDRWQGATEPWNNAGGSLDEYRNMVINHEVGHWLEFGHKNCTTPGDAAPVMQQQSISLRGCKFNAWPTNDEKNQLASNLGI